MTHDQFEHVKFCLSRMLKNQEDILNELRKKPNATFSPLPPAPVYSPITNPAPNAPIVTQNFDWNKCSKCGISTKGVLGYCCPNHDCPCGLGPVTS